MTVDQRDRHINQAMRPANDSDDLKEPIRTKQVKSYFASVLRLRAEHPGRFFRGDAAIPCLIRRDVLVRLTLLPMAAQHCLGFAHQPLGFSNALPHLRLAFFYFTSLLNAALIPFRFIGHSRLSPLDAIWVWKIGLQRLRPPLVSTPPCCRRCGRTLRTRLRLRRLHRQEKRNCYCDILRKIVRYACVIPDKIVMAFQVGTADRGGSANLHSVLSGVSA